MTKITLDRLALRSAKPMLLGILFVTIMCVALALPAGKVGAQEGSLWLPDQRIPGYLDDTFTPFLLADQNRTIHAFASQRVGADNAVGIVYRKWSLKGGWTTPVNILLSPSGEATAPAAFLDSKGVIHLLFFGGSSGSTNIYYSQAPVEAADSFRAWTSPTTIGDKAVGPPFVAITGDDAGQLVMIYTGNMDGSGVYSAYSIDSGLTWSEPAQVFLTRNPGLVPFSLRIYPGRNGQVHAVWNVVTTLGVDVSLHYARFDLETLQWTKPVVLNERTDFRELVFGPSYPSLVDNGSQVVVMYNNGNPFQNRPVDPGRPVQMVSISKDNGDTWEPPAVPFIKHLGRSGEHVIVLDSNHVVHALFIQRIQYVEDEQNKILGGIWHSEYRDALWSDPDRFTTTYAPHDVRAVISQGNVLLVVWRQDPGAKLLHGVWYSYIILNSPELPIVFSPTLLPVSTVTPAPSVLESAVTSTPLVESPVINMKGFPSRFENPAGPLIVAIVTAILVLAVVVILKLLRDRNP